MTETRLRYSIGVSMICANLAILIGIVALYFLKGFDFDQFGTLIGIVLPMFSGYTTAIIAYFVKERTATEDASSPVTKTYAAITFVFPFIFVVIIAFAILMQAFNRIFSDFNQFRGFLTLIESAFATYLGMLIYSLFKEVQVRQPKTPTAKAPTRRKSN